MESLNIALLSITLLLSSVPAGKGNNIPGRMRSKSGTPLCPPGAIETDSEPASIPVPAKADHNHTECYVEVKPGCYMVGRCLSRRGIQGMPGLCQTLDRKYIGLQTAACSTAARARLHRAETDTATTIPSNLNDTAGAVA